MYVSMMKVDRVNRGKSFDGRSKIKDHESYLGRKHLSQEKAVKKWRRLDEKHEIIFRDPCFFDKTEEYDKMKSIK